MKILFATHLFYPEAVGGTTVYTSRVARELQSQGHEATILAGTNHRRPREDSLWRLSLDSWEEIPIWRMAFAQEKIPIGASYAAHLDGMGAFWENWLRHHPHDILHLGGLSLAGSLDLIQAARRSGMSVVISFLDASLVCLKGNLIQWTGEICDGKLEVNRCTHCRVTSLTGQGALGQMARRMPMAVSQSATRISSGYPGLIRKGFAGLGLRALHETRLKSWESLLRWVDGWHVFGTHGRQILMANRVPRERIFLGPPGVHRPSNGSQPQRNGPVRFGYLGGYRQAKGVGLLLQAFGLLAKEVPLQLFLFGTPKGMEEQHWFRKAKAIAQRDGRLFLQDWVGPLDRIAQAYSLLDAVVIPSQKFEMGPMVLLEALAAGIPVIATDLPEIRSRITHGVHGLLIPAGDVRALVESFVRFAQHPELLKQFQSALPQISSVAQHVTRLLAWYQTLLTQPAQLCQIPI